MSEGSSGSEEVRMEYELLKAIYLDDVRMDTDHQQSVDIVTVDIHPATADDKSLQYVRCLLLLTIDHHYPDCSPKFEVTKPRGLNDSQLDHIERMLSDTCASKVGELVLLDLIEQARDYLTAQNTPSEDCVICLGDFLNCAAENIVKTEPCYHYFHRLCFARYIVHAKAEIERERKEAAENKVHLLEYLEEKQVLCPVCRCCIVHNVREEELDALAVEREPNVVYKANDTTRQTQAWLARVLKKQLSVGGLITDKESVLSISAMPTALGDVAGGEIPAFPITGGLFLDTATTKDGPDSKCNKASEPDVACIKNHIMNKRRQQPQRSKPSHVTLLSRTGGTGGFNAGTDRPAPVDEVVDGAPNVASGSAACGNALSNLKVCDSSHQHTNSTQGKDLTKVVTTNESMKTKSLKVSTTSYYKNLREETSRQSCDYRDSLADQSSNERPRPSSTINSRQHSRHKWGNYDRREFLNTRDQPPVYRDHMQNEEERQNHGDTVKFPTTGAKAAVNPCIDPCAPSGPNGSGTKEQRPSQKPVWRSYGRGRSASSTYKERFS